MLILIIYSFNGGRNVAIWAGFSTKWYGELFRDQAFLDAAWVTLRVGLMSSTLATILGTMAAYVIVRGGRFKGRTVMSGMLYAPIVMPEVITGISSLMFFILMAQWVGWPGQRGFTTVTLAHITFSMVFVTTIVQARMLQSDRSIEEAAMDLGSRPWQVLRDVTLPVIFPAIMSGWLLAFTLSLDDLVLASFVSGPSSTTLPIKIFSAVRLGVSPKINALSTLMIAIVAIGVISASLINKRSVTKRLKDEQEAAAS